MTPLAILAFKAVYPRRRQEAKDIFSLNCHDTGCAVDITFSVKGETQRLLGMLNAFTPERRIYQIETLHKDHIHAVIRAVEAVGFKVHSNQAERLQMHFTLSSCVEQYHSNVID